MASRILLLSFSSFVLFNGCFARQQQSSPRFNVCQLDNLDSLLPDNRIKSEAGVTEIWDHSIAVPKGILVHQLHYVVRGTGLLGLSFPGCAETYRGITTGRRQKQRRGDRHQKIREFRQGKQL